MKLRPCIFSLAAAMIALGVGTTVYAADDLERQQKALNIIADFASKLCQDISLGHQTSQFELSASAKAELKGVAKKVADLGFDAATKYTSSSEQGLLQQDLAKAVADSRNCRMKVWDDLKSKLLASGTAAVRSPAPRSEKPAEKNLSRAGSEAVPKVAPDVVVEERIKEILRAKREADDIDLRPALMTSAETQATLEKLNREAVIYDTTVNIPILHRYVREYGKASTRAALGQRLNDYADKHARLIDYVATLLGRFEGEERLNDLDYVTEIYRETVARLNERAAARSALYTFIANLRRADFIGYE